MIPGSRTQPGQSLVLALSLLVALGFWHWSDAILVPDYSSAAKDKGRPIGNNSDLYPLWLGTRELLLHHRDPYSTEVTREIQIGFYGRPVVSQNTSDPADQQAFVYPLQVVLLLAPTANMSFTAVQEIFRWVLLLCVACSVPLWMRANQFRPGWLLTATGMLLAASSFAAVYEYLQQNLSALALLFVAAAAAAAVGDWLVLSGCLLALSTFKPQLSGLSILWLLLWAFAGWKQRNRIVWSFVASMAALLTAAQFLSPHWVGRFLVALREYQQYGTDRNVALMLLPSRLGAVVNVALVIVLALVCWHSRRAAAGSLHFVWAFAWVAAVTLVIVPKQAPHYHLLLVPVLLVLVIQRARIWKMGVMARALVKATFACQLWQWLTASGLSLLSLAIPAERLRAVAEVPMYTFYALPSVAFLAIAVTTIPVLRIDGAGRGPSQ